MTLYAMLFFLMDGGAILGAVLRFTPLSEADKTRLLGIFASVSRATLKGTLVIGLVQGSLAALSFWAAGIEGAVFWGAMMTVLSIIPGVGTALVWVPAVVFLALAGRSRRPRASGLWCAVVVGTVDNVLRPLLIGKDTEMPDLLVHADHARRPGALRRRRPPRRADHRRALPHGLAALGQRDGRGAGRLMEGSNRERGSMPDTGKAESDVERLQQEAAEIRASRRSRRSAPATEERRAEAKEPEADQTLRDLAALLEGAAKEVEEAARQYPALALLAAFTAGIAIGHLLARR